MADQDIAYIRTGTLIVHTKLMCRNTSRPISSWNTHPRTTQFSLHYEPQ